MTQSRYDWDYIGGEVKQLRENEYQCTLRRKDNYAFVIVEINRDTRDGFQPVKVYLRLDPAFPHKRPLMLVTIVASDSPKGNELSEWELEIDSSTRLRWNPEEDRLLDIVLDVAKGVQSEHLSSPGLAHYADQEEVIASMAARHEEQSDAQEPETQAPGSRSAEHHNRGRIELWAGGVLLLIVLAGLIYALFLRDPCADDWRQAQIDLSSTDQVNVRHAVQVLEGLSRRGLTGERGSCRLAANPKVLRDAYLRAATVMLASGDSAQARQDYDNALKYDDGSPEAKASLHEAITAILRPTWDEVNSQGSANAVQWSKVVTDLLQIRQSDPESVNPSTGVTVTLSLFQAYLNWGDQLYSRDEPASALDRYDDALTISPNNPVAAERREWANLEQRMRTIGVNEWPTLLAELNQRKRESPQASDPQGQTIDALLYTAYISYGKALIEQGGAVGELVREQAKNALALQAESGDNGQAAFELQATAEKLLRPTGTLALQQKKLEPTAWAEQQRKYNVPKARPNGKSINLLVVSQDTSITLTITRADTSGTRSLIFDRKGVAFDAIDGGLAILRLTKGDQSRELSLDFSGGATYLVNVVSQD